MGERTQTIVRLTIDSKMSPKTVLLGGYHNQWGYGFDAPLDAVFAAYACRLAYCYGYEGLEGVYDTTAQTCTNYGRFPTILPTSARLYFLMDVLDEKGEKIRERPENYILANLNDSKILSVDDVVHNLELSTKQLQELFCKFKGDNNRGGSFVDVSYIAYPRENVMNVTFFDDSLQNKVLSGEEYVIQVCGERFKDKEESKQQARDTYKQLSDLFSKISNVNLN